MVICFQTLWFLSQPLYLCNKKVAMNNTYPNAQGYMPTKFVYKNRQQSGFDPSLPGVTFEHLNFIWHSNDLSYCFQVFKLSLFFFFFSLHLVITVLSSRCLFWFVFIFPTFFALCLFCHHLRLSIWDHFLAQVHLLEYFLEFADCHLFDYSISLSLNFD